MGYLGQNVTFTEVGLNESNFVSVLTKLIQKPNVQIVFASGVIHEISKKGWCLYEPEGYTRDVKGTYMVTSEGILRMCKIKYLVYAFDLYDQLPGVESVLINFFDRYGIATYQRSLNPEKTYLLKYVPKT